MIQSSQESLQILHNSQNSIKQKKSINEINKKSQGSSIELIKKYLLKKTQNRFKLHLRDQQAFKWKFHQSKDSKPLSTFNLLKKQVQNENNQNNLKKFSYNFDEIQYYHLKQYSFPVLKYKTIDLAQFSIMILKQNKYFKENKNIWNVEILRKLVTQISLNYNIVSYHNFSHAFSLSLMLFQCFQYHQQFQKYYSSEQIFYAILAGFAHDLNHPGTNNAFEVKLKSKLALQANNQSVLEKFHLKNLWNILQKNPEINFLNKVSNSKEIKQRITYLILMTDVAQHFKNLQKIKALRAQVIPKGQNILEIEQNRQFFLGQLFHACDIGNPCIDFENYITWAALLSYQFNQQTKLQQQNKIQITQMLRYKNLPTFYKGQLGFINFMVMPLWKQLASIFPNLEIFTSNISQNIQILNYKIQTAKQQDQIIDIDVI